MHTKLPSAIALALVSLSACDRAPDADGELAHEPLQPSELLLAAIAGDCDRSDADCARALDMAEGLDLAAGPTDDGGLALLQDSCVAPTVAPCSELSLFEPSTSATSHLLSFEDQPVTIDAIDTPPGNGGSVWIMGDWDGDGVDSPGYYAAGAFRYTDQPLPLEADDWSEPLSLNEADRPLVAGRFLASYDNDCVGIIRGAGTNINGDELFYLEYWCDLSATPAAGSNGTQWIGAALPSSSFPTGVHQFAAGDWDGDGIDEIAIRKDGLIAYSQVDPEAGNATLPQAQLWGVPPGELPETGVFVSGDWDGDGTDGWGVLYDDNDFYYRNVLSWNPGPDAYYLQHIDNSFSGRSVSAHRFAAIYEHARASSYPDLEFIVDFESVEVLDSTGTAIESTYDFDLGQILRFRDVENADIQMLVIVNDGTSVREQPWSEPEDELVFTIGDLPRCYTPTYEVQFRLAADPVDSGSSRPKVILRPTVVTPTTCNPTGSMGPW